MTPSARIDPRLKWFKPEFVALSAIEPTLTMSGRRTAYEADALAALRAFAYNVRSRTSAAAFVREHGPLIEPDDGSTVSVDGLGKARRAIVAVWKEWRALDAQTLKHWRSVAADFGAKALPAKLLAAQQEHVAPLLAKVRLNTRLEFDGAGLVLRPNDLQSAMWLSLAQRIAVGDASIECRNRGCGNIVNRSQADGDSMRAVYCETRDRCARIVEREWAKGNKDADRYPQLRGLDATQFRIAARKLQGEEVL